jgi:diketogulonate reductase-like aldo/keto reductase
VSVSEESFHATKVLTKTRCGYRPLTEYPGGPVDKPVKAAAKRLGATEDQVLLAWTKTKGAVVLSYVEGT